MTRPGPKPGGPQKGAPTGIRFDHNLKAKLKTAAKKAGRSFSDEVSLRLNESFQNRCADAFDGEETYAIFRLAALALFHLRVEMNGTRWYESPVAYECGCQCISQVLDQFRPKRGNEMVGNPAFLKTKVGQRSAEQTLVWLEQYAGDYGKSLERLLSTDPDNQAARAKAAQSDMFREIAETVLPLMDAAGTRKGYQGKKLR